MHSILLVHFTRQINPGWIHVSTLTNADKYRKDFFLDTDWRWLGIDLHGFRFLFDADLRWRGTIDTDDTDRFGLTQTIIFGADEQKTIKAAV